MHPEAGSALQTIHHRVEPVARTPIGADTRTIVPPNRENPIPDTSWSLRISTREMHLDGADRLDPQAMAYRPGNREDFDRLYTTTYQRIFRTLAAMLGDLAAAEDCTQDAFLYAFRSWSRWKEDAPAEAWLHRIAINAAAAYRRKQRLREVGELVRRLGPPRERDPYEQLPDPSVMEELRRLPTKQAAALVLRHLHGYSNREIGTALGVSESTIATRLLEAKRTLRARLERSMRPREIPCRSSVPDTSGPLRISLRQ